MKLKLFEIRDAGTFIPVAAMSTDSAGANDVEAWLLRRGGFQVDPGGPIFLMKLQTGGGEYDPYAWPSGSRTMQAAHAHIEEHWTELESGAVVDVEFIMGLSKKPKRSERYD